MTKMSKIKIDARRSVKSAKRIVKNTQRKLSNAQLAEQNAQLAEQNVHMEAQMAFLEEQIALLKGEGRGTRKEGRGTREEGRETREEGRETREENPASPPSSRDPAPTPNDPVTFLQTWLEEQQIMFRNFAELVPQLENTVLNTAARRRLNGSGVRRYGFIDKVSDVAADYPQFWPGSVQGTVDLQDPMKDRLREIEVLRNLLIWLRYVTRIVGDLLLIAGDDAFRMANTYYTTVRGAARNQTPGAQQVMEMIELFWKRPRRATEEPTQRQVERDFCGVLHGKKDGTVSATHESPKPAASVHEVIDKVL